MSCACKDGYECPHLCWNCKGEGACEVWCHLETFPPRVGGLLPGPAPAGEPTRPDELTGRFYDAIEKRVYQYREITCRWGETDGTTEAVSREAARAAAGVAREELRALHERVAQLEAACRAAAREQEAGR